MSNIHRESRQETYDVIVIGAGIGGLTAAALLAKAGKSVLVVERHNRPGGYAHGFRRRHYHFDAGVHLVSGCGPEGYRHGSIIHKVTQALGIQQQANFISLKEYARVVYPGLEVRLCSGEDAYVAAIAEHFPAEAGNIRSLSRLCRELAEEAMRADEVLGQVKDLQMSPAQVLPNLFRYRRATLASVLDEFFTDHRLKSVYASLWPYQGLPPSAMSFLSWATMMAGFTYEGGFYCRGSFQSYANALGESLQASGGELLLGASVRQIHVDHGRAAGVVLENGQLIRSAAVVSNADARQTLEQLLGRHQLPEGYWEKFQGLSPSISVFVVYLATDLPLAEGGHAHETFFFERGDHEKNFQLTKQGAANWFSATVPTLSDPTLAPTGQHLMLLTELCPYRKGQSWREEKLPYQQRLLAKAERYYPGLNGHLVFVESGSPRTLERYTLNHQGAAYGWSPMPRQMGPQRPSIRGCIPGLYQVGHWSRPGGGVSAVSVSGLLVSQALLGIGVQGDFWRYLAGCEAVG